MKPTQNELRDKIIKTETSLNIFKRQIRELKREENEKKYKNLVGKYFLLDKDENPTKLCDAYVKVVRVDDYCIICTSVTDHAIEEIGVRFKKWMPIKEVDSKLFTEQLEKTLKHLL